jgi:RIO kinase 1
MRIPPRLVPLIEDGLIDRVVRPLMSGKEAQVYLVESGGALRAAKVYKEASERSFRNRSVYAEGRKVRNSRDQRAMGKRGSRHGRDRDEQHWKSAEADVIYKLYSAGVRVPKPYAFIEGVLVMECIEGPDGGPAPRLAECTFEREHAHALCRSLIGEVVKMLCADVVHGDLSLFNVLLEDAGPVVIDFPQAVDASRNLNAREILLRDVANLTSTLMSDVPISERRFGYEMWAQYEEGTLQPDTPMTGKFALPSQEVNAERLLHQMMEIEEDAAVADVDDGFDGGRGAGRRERAPARDPGPSRGDRPRGGKPSSAKGSAGPQVVVKGQAPPPPAAESAPASGRRRRRRRRPKGGGS